MKSAIRILMVLSILLIPVGAFADGVLNVPETTQEHDQWCWAASSWIILQHYGVNVQQCELLQQLIHTGLEV